MHFVKKKYDYVIAFFLVHTVRLFVRTHAHTQRHEEAHDACSPTLCKFTRGRRKEDFSAQSGRKFAPCHLPETSKIKILLLPAF